MKISKRRSTARKRLRERVEAEPATFQLEPLDPWLRCGPDTTVTELWKVREKREKEITYHVVYFDRYGWYCEHGPGCKAVAEVRRVVRIMSADAPRPRSSGKPGARKRK